MRRALVLATLLLSAVALLPAAPRETFALGVLRRDGVLIPFTAFNGRDWSTPWPVSDTAAPLPIGLDDVPKKWWGPVSPEAPWTAWMLADGSSRPLKIQKPAQVRVFCGGHVGLKTDYRAEPVDSREPTIAKDALAISADPATVPVLPISEISLLSPDAGRMVKAITVEFNNQERAAAKLFTDWSHPYSPAERERFPIELEAFYRLRENTPAHGDWLVSYVEAVRRFPAGPDDKGCGLITWVRGWVIERAGKDPDIHVTARVTYCDREGVSFMLPLGQLTLDGEVYWVYQMSSWRDEVYTVARMRPDEVRPIVLVAGGNCPRR